MHAKTGAAVAKYVFGEPEEVVEAIRWHTTGKAGMSVLEKVLYLADYIEPNRDFPGVEELRQACYRSLDEGLLMGLQMTADEMNQRGNPIHKNTLEALSELKGKNGRG